jgi:hypothetical protein
MSTGELLDRGFALYRHNFPLFAGIVAPAPAFFLLMQIVQWIHMGNWGFASTRSGAMRVLTWNMAAMVLEWIFGLSITHAATVRAVSAVHLSRPTTIAESYSSLRGRFVRVICITILLLLLATIAAVLAFIAILLPVMVVVAVIGAATGMADSASYEKVGAVAAVIGMIAAGLVTILALARYSLATQACVIEGTSIRASLKRSAVLSKGSLWRITCIYALFIVLNLTISLTLQFSIRFATVPFHSLAVTAVALALAAFTSGVLAGPLATVEMSLVYYDERVRKEAFDLQWMMAVLDGPPASAAVSAT